MQTKLFTLCVLFVLSLPIQSQSTYDYLSRSGLTITAEHYNWAAGYSNNTYRFIGDTLLCGEKLLMYQGPPSYPFKPLLRVDKGKVWRKSINNPCDNEWLIYEFDLEVGDTTSSGYYVVVDTDTITLLNGEKRKKLILTRNANTAPIEWVDGIGSLKDGLFPKSDPEGKTMLVCIKENNETIWLNPTKSTKLCDSIACLQPVPDFDFEVDKFQVNFKNLSINQSSVHWDFGDGNTSTEVHPHHNYENPGCYNVTLALRSDCLTRVFKKQLLVPVCIAQEWQVKSPGLTDGSIEIDFVSESLGWAITNKGRIWKTEDRGISWTEQFYPIPAPPIKRQLATIDMADTLRGVIAVINYSAPSSIEAFLVTNDGGLTWKEKMPSSYLITSAIMTEDGQVFGSGQFDGVYYSNDWGNSFVELPSDGIELSRFQYLGNNKVVALGLQGLLPFHASRTISFSDNSAQSWRHSLLPAAYLGASGFHFFNENVGFVCGYAGFLIKTEDGGKSWQEIKYNDKRKATTIYFINAQIGWAVGESGLVLSTSDGGDTWLAGNCGNRNYLQSIRALDAENCWLGSTHGKYLEFDPNAKGNCTQVNTNELHSEDNNLLIFPNPAFETTTISLKKFNLSVANDKIVIYNNLGQNIYEGNLLNETLTINTKDWYSGVYWILWFRNEQVFGTEKLIVLD